MGSFRRIAVVLCVLATLLLPGRSATARVDACTGVGNFLLFGTTFVVPGLSTPRTGTFILNSSTLAGGCALTGTGLHMNGTITGWCGLALGSGATPTGESFSLLWTGATMVLVGQVVGTVVVAPKVHTGESCVAGADDYVTAGVLALAAP